MKVFITIAAIAMSVPALAADLEEQVVTLCLKIENPEEGYACPATQLEPGGPIIDCVCEEGYAVYSPEGMPEPVKPVAATPS